MPFYPLTDQTKNSKKWKKQWEIWCLRWCVTDAIVIFQIGLFSAPFNCLIAPKMKISKKWKKCLEISSSYTSVPKIMIMCYTVPEIWHVWNYLSFWAIFALLPPNSPKKQNVYKMKIKHLEISSFYTCVPKIMIRWWWFLRYDVQQTDGQKKWHIEVGAPPKTSCCLNSYSH